MRWQHSRIKLLLEARKTGVVVVCVDGEYMQKSSKYIALVDSFIAYLITQRCVAQNTSLAYRRDVAQFLAFWEQIESRKKTARRKTNSAHGKDGIRMILVDFRDFLRNNGVGSRSIARKLSALRSFFNYVSEYHPAEMAGHEVNLMVGAPPRLERRLPRICSLQEIDMMLRAAREERTYPQRAELICYLLYTAGLRVSELAHLTYHNVQLAAGNITLQGKGGKMRTIPLLPAVKDILVSALEVHAKENSSFKKSIIGLSRQSIWRLIKRLARRANIQHPVSPHVLRHSLATHSLEEGWDLRSLQLMLGHERIATTEVYIHLDTKFVKSEYKKRHPRG